MYEYVLLLLLHMILAVTSVFGRTDLSLPWPTGGRLNLDVDPSAKAASPPDKNTAAPARNVPSATRAEFVLPSRDMVVAVAVVVADDVAVASTLRRRNMLLLPLLLLQGATKATDLSANETTASAASAPPLPAFMLLCVGVKLDGTLSGCVACVLSGCNVCERDL